MTTINLHSQPKQTAMKILLAVQGIQLTYMAVSLACCIAEELHAGTISTA